MDSKGKFHHLKKKSEEQIRFDQEKFDKRKQEISEELKRFRERLLKEKAEQEARAIEKQTLKDQREFQRKKLEELKRLEKITFQDRIIEREEVRIKILRSLIK